MKMSRCFLIACLLAFLAIPATAQDREAPNITGMAVQGVSVNLEYFEGEKNVLVVFYRMHTWPFCKAQLGELQEYYDDIQALDAEVVALSADPPATARETVLEMNLRYPVLSDAARKFIQDYDVLHPQEGISRPAAFIIDREGRIRWQFIGMSASERAPIGIIMNELQALQ
jgi:peroxiredoxin